MKQHHTNNSETEFKERYQQLEKDFTTMSHVQPCLRINTLKIVPEVLIARLKQKKVFLSKVEYLPQGYAYKAPFSLGATPEYLQGYYYLQEAASQIPAIILDPKPGETVLDMAAAPGSKTTQMAQMMQNKGIILALDNNGYRLKSLGNNIERMGITNAVICRKDARFAFDLKKTFDKVLLDAQCTGNFCIDEGFFEKKNLVMVKENARIQKELLRAAVKCLKPGGTLIYSTCSLEPEENEQTIDWFLGKYPDCYLEKINFPIGQPGYTEIFGEKLNPELSKTLRLWPHKTNTQAFFIAKIRKK